MKAKLGITILAFSLCFLVLLVQSENKQSLIQGRIISPVMDHRGQFQYLVRHEKNQIHLVNHGLPGNDREVQNILESEGICEPVIKKDPAGGVRMIWVDHKPDSSKVYSGFLQNSELSETCLWFQTKRSIHSPDFCFDGANILWMVWSFHHKAKDWIMVTKTEDDTHFVLNSSGYGEVRGLKILADVENRIWVFWTGVLTGREEVFFAFFDRGTWSEPESINESHQYPHILLDAEISPLGFPWLVWSAYDGQDYEIYERHWTSFGWSEETPLTDNLCADLFPDIDLVWDHIPIMVWSRSGREEKAVFFMYKQGDHWSQEIKLIKGPQEHLCSPKVVTDRGKIGLVWESGLVLHSEIFYFSDLTLTHKDHSEKISTEININPSLHDDVYIAFGDSITYGYVDSSPAPDLGYVPRLEGILDSTYGDSEVINQGNPGERTLGGLSRISDVLSKEQGKYLLLMEGTNDVVTNSITMDTAAFNLQEMAETCLDQGVLPLISTILPRNDMWWYFPFYKQRIYTLNDRIREIPGELNIPFIDMFHEFYYYRNGEQDWRSLLSQDGLHPNEEGYEFMAEKWFEQIELFPFPPTILEGIRTYDETLFDSEMGNLIKWQENSKLTSQHIFKGYKVYRKTDTAEMSDFREIAFLPTSMMVNFKQYFDSRVDVGKDYFYTVCLVRSDGVEGPCSNIMLVGSLR